MLICGVKLTHDGGIAVVKDDTLLFSTEMEKIGNNPRYSDVRNIDSIAEILAMEGLDPADIDRFVIDGWHGADAHWKGGAVLECVSGRRKLRIPAASYHEMTIREDVTQGHSFHGGFEIGGRDFPYNSYKHACGHILSAYCTSPFAQAKEDSYVLVWDGGQYPRLYYIDAVNKRITNKGYLFNLLGTAYSVIGLYFGPYRKSLADIAADIERMRLDGHFTGHSIAGKIMSYIALGREDSRLQQVMLDIYERNIEISNIFEFRLCEEIRHHADREEISDEDVLLNFHYFIQHLLLRKLQAKVKESGLPRANLCFAGGSALNIKWNSAIRASGIFKDLYVPPFPNDTGSALGMACAEIWRTTPHTHINWSVYSGPALTVSPALPRGCSMAPCSLEELARLLHESNEPVVFLNDRAELGPRALGNRSILAAAVSASQKDRLNRAKKREDFRPVAPICLEEDAPLLFDPGCRDPFMLFDHKVRPAWQEKVPAICHLDGTARVQTVGPRDGSPAIRQLLTYYKAASGIPLLCNTSANLNGSGFFPDVSSAVCWGQVRYVWSSGQLYTIANPG